jgi:hypothetical protein
MKFALDTGLNIESSRKAADMAIAEYAKKFPQYSPFLNWTGDTAGEFGFTAAGTSIKGSAQVQEGSITVEFKELPFLARLLIPSAMETVKAEVKVWAQKVASA